MNAPEHEEAWLEKPDGGRVAVAKGLSLGRAPDNSLMLTDERVSRRHALIHPQGSEGCWLVDLGSRNGTYLNAHRVGLPVRLHDGDRIQIGPFTLVFHQARAAAPASLEPMTTQQTWVELRTQPCWLLVAALLGLDVAELPGGWCSWKTSLPRRASAHWRRKASSASTSR
jgi:adenylate cyclase